MGSQRVGHNGSDLAHTHKCHHPEVGAAPSRFQERRHMQVLCCSAVSVWNLSTGYRVFLIWRSCVFAERSGSDRWGNELQPASQIHSQAKGSRCPPGPGVLATCLSLRSWALVFFTWPETLICCLGCIKCIMQWPRSYFTWLTSVCIIRRHSEDSSSQLFKCTFIAYFCVCVFSEDQYLLWASFSSTLKSLPQDWSVVYSRGSSRPGTEQSGFFQDQLLVWPSAEVRGHQIKVASIYHLLFVYFFLISLYPFEMINPGPGNRGDQGRMEG